MAKQNSLAVTGASVGLVSLAFDWLVFKPTRLSAGSGYKLWEADVYAAGAVLAVWLVILALALGAGSRSRFASLGILANVLVAGIFVFAGAKSAPLLQNESLARVSLGVGVWVSLLGAFLIVLACRQELKRTLAIRTLITWGGVIAFAGLLSSGHLNNLSVVAEYLAQRTRFIQELYNHILLFTGSVLIGALIGIPLGIWARTSRRAGQPILLVSSAAQTVPSLALFGLIVAPLSALSFAFPVLRDWGIRGVGTAPALIALILYSLLPIIRNTYTGLKQLDPAMIDAAAGIGMNRLQVFGKIEARLSAPVVLEGVRIAAVQAVGNTAVAALIGAGGLGWFIFQGLAQAADDVVILGAMPIIGLALLVDGLMRGAVKAATPKPLRG